MLAIVTNMSMVKISFERMFCIENYVVHAKGNKLANILMLNNILIINVINFALYNT